MQVSPTIDKWIVFFLKTFDTLYQIYFIFFFDINGR